MTEDEAVSKLRSAYRKGTLDVVVGAGASIGAGLPGWDELNARVLQSFLGGEYEDLAFQQSDLNEMAAIFARHFGREAVVDLVREVSSDASYRKMLKDALYGLGAKDVGLLHYELAALLSGPHRLPGLHTFNFDDLLERAITQLSGRRPLTLVGGAPRRGRSTYVRHLHGFMPERGDASELLVLSERDYHQARDDSGQEVLEDLLLLDPGRTVLFVGLSLTDSRLRSVLLRRHGQEAGVEIPEVIAVVSPALVAGDGLIDRLAGTFVSKREVAFWASWPLHLVRVPQHESIPLLLRRMRLGSDGRHWARMGNAFLRAKARDFGHLYERQAQLVSVLGPIREFLRRRYAVPANEELELGAFVPTEDGRIRLGFQCWDWKGAPLLTETHARRRTLSVDYRRPQGAAGFAFVRGHPIEVGRGSPLLDLNFSKGMMAAWTSYRVFSSMLCVPVYDSSGWVPVGLIYLTSNAPKPFWARLERDQELDRLFAELRNIFTAVLEIDSAVINEPPVDRPRRPEVEQEQPAVPRNVERHEVFKGAVTLSAPDSSRAARAEARQLIQGLVQRARNRATRRV